MLLPLAVIIGIMWYLSRQVRGAGMQALTFGRSLARMIHPDEENNRVTFANIAGCKEQN